MSATITSNSGGIKRSGVTVENEPIIKSDGAGEVMQWQPSDGAADGIFITENSAGSALSLGVGVTTPANPLSVSPIQYNTGTAAQSGTTVTGSGTTWTAAMVGSQFVYADGTTSGAITARASNTSVTVTTSQTVASQAYGIHYTGLQVSAAGNVGVGVTATNKFQIGSIADTGYAGNDIAFGNGTQAAAIYQSATETNFYTNTAYKFNNGLVSCAAGLAVTGNVTTTGSVAANNSVSCAVANTGTGFSEVALATDGTDWKLMAWGSGTSTPNQLSIYNQTTATHPLSISSTGAVKLARLQTVAVGAVADATLQVGSDGATNAYSTIGFGYSAGTNLPALITYKTTDGAGSSAGSLGFYTRSDAGTPGDIVPVERLNISAAGVATFSEDIFVNGATSCRVGNGNGGAANCTALGSSSLLVSHAQLARTVAVGTDTLKALAQPSNDNTAIGSGSMTSLIGHVLSQTGDENTAVGSYSLHDTTQGRRNTAVGKSALQTGNCVNDNTAIGTRALLDFAGSNATAVGSNAAIAATSAAQLVVVGKDAAGAITSATDVTAIGYQSLKAVTTTTLGGYCTAVGSYAGKNFIRGSNTAIGYGAGMNVGYGTSNTAIGVNAMLGASAAAGTITDASTTGGSTAVGFGSANATVNVNQRVVDVTSERIPEGTYVASITGTYGSVTACVLSQAATGSGTLGSQNLAFYQTNTNNCVAIGANALATVTTGSQNIAIGSTSLDAVNTGSSNVAIGHNAGTAVTTGSRNIILGEAAAAAILVATDNIVIGSSALDAANGTESYNIAIGTHSLGTETSNASGCVAIGHYALNDQNVAAANNVAIGFQAALNLDDGKDSVYVGYQAGGVGVITGDDNVAIGQEAGLNMTSAEGCVFVGRRAAGLGVVTGDNNVAIGNGAGYDLTSGVSNVLIGTLAGQNLTAGAENIAIGHNALAAVDTGTARNYNVAVGTNTLGGQTSNASYCVAIGHNALISQNTDVKNTVIGGLAGDAIVAGNKNTLVGYSAGSLIYGGTNNTVMGHNAYVKGTASDNTVIGMNAGSSVVDGTATASMEGSNNVLVGSHAGYGLTTGPGNVLVGKDAGKAMTTGSYNVAIGFGAADALAGNASDNIAIGANALGGEDLAQFNIAIGRNALLVQNDTAAVNLAIGYTAGTAISTGTKNVLIGHEAGSALATGGNCTALGYNALKLVTGGANTAIGNTALQTVVAGASNTAVGHGALKVVTAGATGNVAVGADALGNLAHADSDGNIAIGKLAGASYETTPGSGPSPDGALTQALNSIYIGEGSCGIHATTADNEIVIGFNAVGNGADSFTLGNASTAALHCADTSIAALSDRRVKHAINDNAVGLDFINKLATVNYKKLNPADWPTAISLGAYREQTYKDQLVTAAVEAAEAVYEDAIVQEARAAVAEETREEVHAAIEEVTEDVVTPAAEAVYEDRVVVHAEAERTETRITQEEREEIKNTRHKHSEEEVTETVTGEEIVEVDGKWTKRATSEEVTRTVRTPLYEDCDLYDEDGLICTHCVTEAVEAVAAVVDEDGNEIEAAVEAVAEVRANDVHKVPVMEEYISQTAQEEVTETIVTPAVEEVTERALVSEATEETTETRVVVEAKAEWTETHVTRPAEAAQEEVTERRLVSEAVEAADAVYETVTVPADNRPADDDTIRLGLIAQDVQTAMTEAGVEFDIVNESPNGKLSLKYGNLVMPLIKAVQELSARVKTLEG